MMNGWTHLPYWACRRDSNLILQTDRLLPFIHIKSHCSCTQRSCSSNSMSPVEVQHQLSQSFQLTSSNQHVNRNGQMDKPSLLGCSGAFTYECLLSALEI